MTILRLLRLYSVKRNTHLIATNLEPIKFNQDDKDAIQSILKLVPLNRETVKNNAVRSKSNREYIDRKISTVKSLFPSETGSELLSMKPPDHLKNPFFDVYSKSTYDADGKVLVEGTDRLSVTKLLTKRWCELNQMYDIYSRKPIFEHIQLKIGKQEHEKLETAIHGIAPGVKIFMDTYEWELANDELHELADAWFQCINRLLTLFSNGEAREILCHGYLDSRTCKLIDGCAKDDKDILVSGVIDHIILFHVDSGKPKSLDPNLRESNNNDMYEILESLTKTVQRITDLQIAVSDVKTRPTATVPRYASVVNASKLQVMYYRNFLETLGKDSKVTFDRLLINAERRGISVDEPINISNLIYFMEIDPSIRPDLEKIMNGEAIGFEPYDDSNLYTTENASNETSIYDLSQYSDLTIDETTLQRYGVFYQKWARPPTLRYFAARLAQLYQLVAQLLSDRLMIEYYKGSYNFHTERFKYDPEFLNQQCYNSARFWFGKRPVEPIPPTNHNLATHCKYCDYHDVCSWRANGINSFKQLGSDLQEINKV